MPPAQKGELKQAVLVGAGRMGVAMARGWLRSLKTAGIGKLHVVEPDPSAEVAAWGKSGKISLNRAANPADIVVLAVKPQGFAKAAPSIGGWVGPDTLVISIMAGVTIRGIGEALGVSKVARAMPNTPGAIGKGVTGYALSSLCGETEKSTAEKLLAPLGGVVGPLEEKHIDAVTAVSGSGPAYVFLLAEALEGAARAAGLDSETAATLARKTVIGAGALLAEGGDPAELRKAVTSPGGTTAAALDILMARGAIPELMRKAVEAAARRGAELSLEAEKKS
ncbi:MAG TPA: pyrroline-5-carboxylate reductase [Hyphomonadaceae bacterium]|nr:pyrroline-5-carboxylate reductase [Hyphomonadaceae bacterium]